MIIEDWQTAMDHRRLRAGGVSMYQLQSAHPFVGSWMWSVIAALLALLASTSASDVTARPASIDSLSVAGQVSVSPKEVNGEVIALSPDGQWLAIERESEICVFVATTLAEHACASFTNGPIDRQTAAWSPHGSRLAFTEDPNRSLEPDLWILEAETGRLNNLTDEGNNCLLGFDDCSDALLDLAPAWTPDGREIVFARSTRGNSGTTALYRVAVAGGEPTELVVVSPNGFGKVSRGVRWAPDGATIYYTILGSSGDPQNGIWAANADGSDPRPVLGSTAFGGGEPILLDVSARGALLVSFVTDARPGVLWHAVADLTTGKVEPVAPPNLPSTYVQSVLFSPDGLELLIGYGNFEVDDDDGGLVVRSINGDEEQIVHEDVVPPITGLLVGRKWATNNLVYFERGGGAGLILRLESDA